MDEILTHVFLDSRSTPLEWYPRYIRLKIVRFFWLETFSQLQQEQITNLQIIGFHLPAPILQSMIDCLTTIKFTRQFAIVDDDEEKLVRNVASIFARCLAGDVWKKNTRVCYRQNVEKKLTEFKRAVKKSICRDTCEYYRRCKERNKQGLEPFTPRKSSFLDCLITMKLTDSCLTTVKNNAVVFKNLEQFADSLDRLTTHQKTFLVQICDHMCHTLTRKFLVANSHKNSCFCFTKCTKELAHAKQLALQYFNLCSSCMEIPPHKIRVMTSSRQIETILNDSVSCSKCGTSKWVCVFPYECRVDTDVVFYRHLMYTQDTSYFTHRNKIPRKNKAPILWGLCYGPNRTCLKFTDSTTEKRCSACLKQGCDDQEKDTCIQAFRLWLKSKRKHAFTICAGCFMYFHCKHRTKRDILMKYLLIHLIHNKTLIII